MIWLMPGVAAVLYTIRATPWSKLRFWWSWSPTYAVCSVSITIALLYVNSVLGILVISRGMTSGVDWTGSLAGALAAPAVTRRANSSSRARGATLALGTLGAVQGWFKALLEDAIERWARDLSDEGLDTATAVIDRMRRGHRPPSTVRASLRDERRNDMKKGGTLRDETRADLIAALQAGYVSFEIPRSR